MADYINKIRTTEGDKPVNYEALANKPSSLPNPNKIKFTGSVVAEYDGSSEVTVNIPNGASEEQAAQIQTNTNDISELKNKTSELKGDLGVLDEILNVRHLRIASVTTTGSHVRAIAFSGLSLIGGHSYTFTVKPVSVTTNEYYLYFVDSNGAETTINDRTDRITYNFTPTEDMNNVSIKVSSGASSEQTFECSWIENVGDNEIVIVNKKVDDLVNATDPLIDVNTTVIPTMISGLNFPANANAYSSDSSYNTFYVPVRNGYAYLWSITEKGSVDAYVRFAYSQNFPANGVSGTFLGEIAISKSETATFYYTAPADGYLAFAVWNEDVDANDCNIAVTRQGLKATVDGIEAVSMTPTKIKNLNFADGDTAYVSASEYEYDTFYIPVASGKSYTWVVTKASGTDPYCRFAFATSIPANGVSATQIHDEIHVFTTNTFVYTATSDGYVSMSVYIDNMPIENQTVTCNKQNGLVDRVTDIEAIVSNDRANLTNKRLLYYAKESLAQDSTQVKLGDLVVVPYNAVELSIVCPDDICVYFTLIKSAYDNTSTTTGYYGNGDTVKLAADYDLYRIHFAYCTKSGDTYTLTGETLALDTVINLIVTNMLRIEYDGESVIINNKDIEKKLWSAIRNSDFVISHISDTHGDAIRYDSFLEMSKYIDVDVAINSGDAVNQNLSDGCKYIEHGIAEYPDLSTIFCFGNHDAYATNALNASAYVSPFDTAYEYDVATDGTYYYKDYTDKSIRIIVLNIYEERRSQLFSCRISQDQIEWFIDTLESTPSGYGVIVVTHSMENYIGKVTGYDAFYEDGVTDNWCCRFSGITGYPVRDIIDAFIAKTSITGSYTQTVLTAVGESTTETETVTYSADFTSVHAEFIASINGHQHCDMIGYINGSAQTQLNLNITHGVAAHYYADQGDITRADGKGSVQDAFNIYAIDRTAKTVNVIRIGSNVTDDMSIREYMSIPYTE